MGAGAASERRDDEETRLRRARGIVAMQLVERRGDIFLVKSPTLRAKQQTFEVKRNEAGKVICSCEEFTKTIALRERFRCEHILAIKIKLESASPFVDDAAAARTAATGALSKEDAHAPRPSNQELHVVPTHSEPVEKAAPQETEELEASTAEVITLNSFTATLKRLRQRIDPALIKTREGFTDSSGQTQVVEYVEWHAVADILDRVAPTWQHSVKNVQTFGQTVAITASITIDGITREGIGTGSAESETGIKKAEHDALKRAAVKFGIARELYRRESLIIDREGTVETTPAE